MDKEWEDIIKIMAEDIRETKALTKQVARQADATEKNAEAAMRRADAAWELVVITRNDMQRPWYRKLLGLH